MTRHVAIYLRVSTDHQDVDRQRADLYRLAADEFPGVEVREYVEQGVSAFKHSVFDRPKSKELVAAIHDGHVLAVLADRQNRFSRGRQSEWWAFYDLCKGSGTRVFQSSGEIVDDEAGEIVSAVDQMRARRDSLEKSHLVRSGFARIRAQGHAKGGRPTRGYDRLAGGKLVPNEEADTVRAIHDAYANEKSLSHCLRLAQATFGPKYDRVSLKRYILANPTYIGKIPHRGEALPGAHEPLIDEQTWARVQRRLEAERGGASYRDRATQPYGRLARCGVCGGYLAFIHSKHAQDGRAFSYFKCDGRCTNTLPAELFDANVLFGIWWSAHLIQELYSRADKWSWLRPDAARVTRLQNEIADLDDQEHRLVEAITTAGITPEIAGTKLKHLADEKQQLTVELDAATRGESERRAAVEQTLEIFETIQVAIRTIASDTKAAFIWTFEAWMMADRDARRLMLTSLLDQIVLDAEKLTLRFRLGIDVPIPIPINERRRDYHRGEQGRCWFLTQLGFGQYEVGANESSPS